MTSRRFLPRVWTTWVMVIVAGAISTGDRALAQAQFRRGDCNVDGVVDIADASFLSRHLFLGEPPSACESAQDIHDDGGSETVTSVVCLLLNLFGTICFDPPPGPFTIGPDPTPGDPPCAAYDPAPPPPLGEFELGFECPAEITGAPGETVTFQLYATLTPRDM